MQAKSRGPHVFGSGIDIKPENLGLHGPAGKNSTKRLSANEPVLRCPLWRREFAGFVPTYNDF
jgi:hypothetical protein